VFLKTAVLTGATGFVGFALLNELIKNGVYVYVLCRPNSRRRARLNGLPGITVIETDLTHAETIDTVQAYDVFYHLAWEGERNNFEQQYKNIGISVNCLKLAAGLGCKRFICTGSQAEYGSTTELITEYTPLMPTTSYGACKTAAFYLTMDLASRISIEHTWVRIFSTYGPNDNPSTLIMNLVRGLRQDGSATLVTNGGHIWNYLYEGDAARALRLLGANEGVTGVYNLASRECKPLKHFVEEARQIVAPNASLTYGHEESAVNLNVSTEKIRRVIGEFENTAFSEGIRRIYSIEK
jgi:nucleoside-diphosphate-sugar epimerase